MVMNEIAITINDAYDKDFVVDQVGAALYTHLRGLNRVADARYEAVERAGALYEKAVGAGEMEPRVAGLGLLVFQRALLICEDLLAVLWALGRKDPWKGLTNYYARDLTKLALGFLEGRRDLHTFFLAPDEAAIAEQELTTEQADALTAWANVTRRSHERYLQLVCAFWMSHHRIGKATMHGFGMVAREYLESPPGGGVLSQFNDQAPKQLYAAVLMSRVDQNDSSVATEHHWAEVHPDQIELYRNTAVAASNLLYSLRSGQLARLAGKKRWHLHGAHVDRLTPGQTAAIKTIGDL